MKYLLLIRDIKDASRSYTHLVQWEHSQIYSKCCYIQFRTIRYYEDDKFQVVMLEILENMLGLLEHNLQAENLFQYYMVFDDYEIKTYGEIICDKLGLNFKPEFEKLEKPII